MYSATCSSTCGTSMSSTLRKKIHVVERWTVHAYQPEGDFERCTSNLWTSLDSRIPYLSIIGVSLCSGSKTTVSVQLLSPWSVNSGVHSLTFTVSVEPVVKHIRYDLCLLTDLFHSTRDPRQVQVYIKTLNEWVLTNDQMQAHLMIWKNFSEMLYFETL